MNTFNWWFFSSLRLGSYGRFLRTKTKIASRQPPPPIELDPLRCLAPPNTFLASPIGYHFLEHVIYNHWNAMNPEGKANLKAMAVSLLQKAPVLFTTPGSCPFRSLLVVG